MSPPPRPTQGFTLVEILVVLAVVVILAAILFPVFARVRENGRSATCVSNLRQLGLAWQMYADDSDGRVMPSLIGVGDRAQSWAGVFPVEGEEARDVAGTGLLHPWLKSGQAVRCPSWTDPSWTDDEASLQKDGEVQGYGYNSSSFPPQIIENPRQLPLLSSIEKPGELVVFADAAQILPEEIVPLQRPAIVLASFYVGRPSAGSPRFHGRHNGWGNVLWADGHVKAMQPVYFDARRGRAVKLQQSFRVGFIDRDGKSTTNEFFELNPDAK